MAQFERKKKTLLIESHTKKMSERPSSEDTNTMRHRTPFSTGHPRHTRRHPLHLSTLPKRLPGC